MNESLKDEAKEPEQGEEASRIAITRDDLEDLLAPGGVPDMTPQEEKVLRMRFGIKAPDEVFVADGPFPERAEDMELVMDTEARALMHLLKTGQARIKNGSLVYRRHGDVLNELAIPVEEVMNVLQKGVAKGDYSREEAVEMCRANGFEYQDRMSPVSRIENGKFHLIAGNIQREIEARAAREAGVSNPEEIRKGIRGNLTVSGLTVEGLRDDGDLPQRPGKLN